MKKSHSVKKKNTASKKKKKNTASKKRKLTPMQPLEDVTTSSMNAIARAQSATPTMPPQHNSSNSGTATLDDLFD